MDICERGIVHDHGKKVFDGAVYGAVAHMRNPPEDVRGACRGHGPRAGEQDPQRQWQAREAAERGGVRLPTLSVPDLDGPLAG
ncbi:hypothetical protein QJS66_22885 [Kocuria rhizophila]|nr:hypothetical protein QJS66_22885 [Kocuria rhizophila]